MKDNPLVELGKVGQSVWYDQMQRSLVTTGALGKMIEEDDLRGLTSNPTIFEKAIAGSEDYNDSLRQLAENGKNREEIYDAVVIEDISLAADAFRPVFDRYHGNDGFVSLEVSPGLAADTGGTASEAQRLFKALNRPNAMIKIPATAEGIPAIEESIARGININITLIFSQAVYAKVMEAYIRGLERRAAEGKPIDGIRSVASFFVSRIDTIIDKQLEAAIAKSVDSGEKARLGSLLGKVAIANAKVAYQMFRDTFGTARFAALKAKGAALQRPLWASTGTKNPKYSDVLYIESLIGPDSVNTIPPKTYDAFRDHGKVAVAIDKGVDEARQVLKELAVAGISLDEATDQLTREGVSSFNESFASLMNTIETRRQAEVVS